MAILRKFLLIWTGIAAFFGYFAAWILLFAWASGDPAGGIFGFISSVAIPATLIWAICLADQK